MKRLLKWIAGVILSCGLLILATNLIVMTSTSKNVLSADQLSELKTDCIIVLGAKVSGDTLSPVLQKRMDAALMVYKAGCSDKLLLSGDHGQTSYDEVNAMRDYARERGIDDNNIFLDHAGFSTYESMYRTRDIFQAKKVMIVTQGFHLPRALYIARSLGLEAHGFEAEAPSNLNLNLNLAREVIARTKDVVTCIFQPGPTYLGAAIPISGSGFVTHDKE